MNYISDCPISIPSNRRDLPSGNVRGGRVFCRADTPQPDQVPPNIFVIYANGLGYGNLGSYGHHTLRTPTLDRLAQDGMRLTSYYAPAPLCSPSRASLLTGRTHYRTGIESAWPDSVERWGKRAPLTRLGMSEDVGDACLFLASSGTRWITGANLRVDGGVMTNQIFWSTKTRDDQPC